MVCGMKKIYFRFLFLCYCHSKWTSTPLAPVSPSLIMLRWFEPLISSATHQTVQADKQTNKWADKQTLANLLSPCCVVSNNLSCIELQWVGKISTNSIQGLSPPIEEQVPHGLQVETPPIPHVTSKWANKQTLPNLLSPCCVVSNNLSCIELQWVGKISTNFIRDLSTPF